MMQIPTPDAPPVPPLPPVLPDFAPFPPGDPFVAFLQGLPPQVVVLIIGGMLAVTGVVLYPLARAIARRIEGGGGRVAREELEVIRQRLAELEEGQVRLAELEERLDFNERVLAGQREGAEGKR